MGLLYTAFIENGTLTDAAQDIFTLATSAAVPLKLHQVHLTANVTTDVRARLQIIRRSTAGSAGTGVTPSELFSRNTVAAATTVTSFRTTPGTAGEVLHPEIWSLLVPFDWTPIPELRPQVGVSGFLGIHLVAGTGASRSISGWVTFEED